MFLSPFQSPFQNPFMTERATASGFLPTDIASLEQWADFSDITSLFQDSAKTTPVTSDGDVIGAVADKSLNGKDFTQVTTSKKPTYKTGIKNGLSIGRFVSTNYLASSLTLSQPITIYSVIFPAKTDNNSDYISYTGSPFIGRASNTSQFLINAGALIVDNTATPVILNWNVFYHLFNSSSSELRKDDESKTIGDAGTNSLNNLSMSKNAINAFLGDIAEQFVFSAALSAEDDANMLNYINTKWSVY